MINIIISLIGAKYVCFDIENFYLSTPLGKPECVKIQLSKIPQEFIEEYNLTMFAHRCWVYFEIRLGCYGLPQPGILENKQLRIGKKKDTMKPVLHLDYGSTTGYQSNSA